MKTKKAKRPKLVFGHHGCLQQWVWRTKASEDVENDPQVRVMTAETAGDIVHLWARLQGVDWEYTCMHPSGGPIRKLESHGRILKAFGLLPLAKFIGDKDNPFWLINYQGADSVTMRCRGDLFRVLRSQYQPNELTEAENSTNQFAFVPNELIDVTPKQIASNWGDYCKSFLERIDSIDGSSRWLAQYLDLVFKSITKEYLALGKFVGAVVNKQDLSEQIEATKKKVTAKNVLRKLKEK